MANLYEFKKNERQPRLQNIEEKFSYGMQYSNTPLEEGFSKLLINFDMQDRGDSLTPRPGLRTVQISVPAEDNEDYCTGEEQLLSASEQYIQKEAHSQFMVLKVLDEDPVGDIQTGAIAMLTTTDDTPTEDYAVKTN